MGGDIEDLELEIGLKDQELELAELVIQDFKRQKEHMHSKDSSQVCETYSPSVNSNENSRLSQSLNKSFCRKERRNSLMQDLFDSHPQEQDFHFESRISQ